MEKRKTILICFACILVVIAISVFFVYKDANPTVINYVKRNSTELMNYAESVIKDNNYNSTATYNGWDVSYWAESNMVEFLVKGSGLGSATTYEGFYYSPDDKPIGFQGADVDFEKENIGWRWEDSTGDNWNYTEKIIDRWYWFKMSF